MKAHLKLVHAKEKVWKDELVPKRKNKHNGQLTYGSSIWYAGKIFVKADIFRPLIRKTVSPNQGIRNVSFSGNFEFKWMICVMQSYVSLKIMFDMFQSYFHLFQVSSMVQKYLHAIYEYIYQYEYL